MFVLACAGPRSRRGADPVPALLTALEHSPHRLRAERTLGDEVLVLADTAEGAVDAVRIAAELGAWSVGLGVGHVESSRLASVREARGQAVVAALNALSAAHSDSGVPISVRSLDARHAESAADAEAVLRLIGWMIATRNAGQWRTVRAMRARPRATQAQIADELGITQQSVSRAVKTSGWREESAAYPLVQRVLAMIDLTSDEEVPSELISARPVRGRRRAVAPDQRGI